MKIFISYAREDVQQADDLSTILRAGGHDPWYDTELLPGQHWQSELEKAIDECPAFVSTLSSHSLNSDWCNWELATATQMNKAIIPVLLEAGLTLPASIRNLQVCDFSNGQTAIQAAKLMRTLDSMQRIPKSLAPPVPASPQGLPSRASEALIQGMKGAYSAMGMTKTFPLQYGEVVLETFVAKYIKGVWANVGGMITLTNQRMIFEKSKWQLARTDPFYIPLSEIAQLIPKDTLWMPIGLTIRCRSGEEFVFTLYYRNKFLQLIEDNRRHK
jgi:hypothetical protein